jgi:methylamine---glutamate N-methyltransferase subunit A
MCGIVGLQLRDPALYPNLGSLLSGMLAQVAERGPDSAGVALYGDPTLAPPGCATISLLAPTGFTDADTRSVADELGAKLAAPIMSRLLNGTMLVSSPVELDALDHAVRDAIPGVHVIGAGESLAVLKGVGHPMTLAAQFGLPSLQGWQGLAHTRMATESAVTPAHAHPFSAGDGLCVVHNGSFANHATIRRELLAAGARFDSDNDSEVCTRFVAAKLAEGEDLEKALRGVCERFDGFYTLLVTTATSFAVVRDTVACKPALIAETSSWVAMASEYRALETLPGIEAATVFEPAPGEVYLWSR